MDKIWYKSPATDFAEAIPVGNGRLGAKLSGEPRRERIFLNEESLWSAPFIDRVNKDALPAISRVRQLLAQGQQSQAAQQIIECFTGVPEAQAFYKPAGEVVLEFYDAEHRGSFGECSSEGAFTAFTSYRREIDLAGGICSVQFSLETSTPSTEFFSQGTGATSITFTRECFASVASNVLVFHVSASTPKSVFFRMRLEKSGLAKKYALSGDTIAALDVSGIPSAILAMAVCSSGEVFVRGDNLIVEGADDATVYIDAETAFRRRRFRRKGGRTRGPLAKAYKCADLALRRVCFASGVSYENLKAEHIADFSAWTQSCLLSIEGEDEGGKSSDELAADAKNARLAKWHLSKYKMISSCKECSTLPCVAGGLWTGGADSRGFSFHGTSPYKRCAGILGLEWANLPFFALAKRIYKHGKAVASKMYGAQGYVLHTASDIWGDAAPCGMDLHCSYLPFGALEITRALLDYYEFSQDKRFLKKHLYLIKKAADFFESYLVPLKDTSLVLFPAFTHEISGEGTDGATGDSAKIAELFESLLFAMGELGVKSTDERFVRYTSLLQKLPHEQPCGETRSHDEGFFGFLCETVDAIVSSDVKGGCVEITLLESLPHEWPAGSLERVHLKGNLFATVKWREGKLDAACIWGESGTHFAKEIALVYGGKRYETQLSGESLDVLNVLPATI